MANKLSQWLKSKKQLGGQKPGLALVKWLNNPEASLKFVEDLLMHAQVVFRWLRKYPSFHELNKARKQGKLPFQFWNSQQTLNDMLADFTFAPQVDVHDLPESGPVDWIFVGEKAPIALRSLQVRCVLQLIEQKTILNVRTCQQCGRWFFAQFKHQTFCTPKCRGKHMSQSPEFKAKRREYMREYLAVQKKKNVK